MSKSPAPSPYILLKACKLGQKMAQTERLIKPVLYDAQVYSNYDYFKQAHRNRLEQISVFHTWDEKLQLLLEQEINARHLNLDNPNAWDFIDNKINSYIRNSFWSGWEKIYHLEHLYYKHLEMRRQNNLKFRVIHVYNSSLSEQPAAAALPDNTEIGMWEEVATKLFDKMDGDNIESLWMMPDPMLPGLISPAATHPA